MTRYDMVIIGAGPAGMAAAVSAYENGAERVLILERNAHLGGILKQCIHDGFGLFQFKESMTGPEYAARYAKILYSLEVDIVLNAMVTKITPEREVLYVTREGLGLVGANAIILSTGCRERTRGMLELPGTRPAGIYTAGVVQKLINIQNIKPGSKVVILGSGDIGMIMARRLTLEGIEVVCVLEKLPYLSGLLRNKNQCLDDYNIPLKLCHTIVDIKGTARLECVIAAEVDTDGSVMSGTEFTIDCDTLLLSVGLIPENELAKACGIEIDELTGGPKVNTNLESTVAGIFCAGNSLHVHPLADHASEEGAEAGLFAAKYALRRNMAV
jgi:NADPH-dependent 2,4-dienoyl-CoA reductase/sulfur reductase-like enzyme